MLKKNKILTASLMLSLFFTAGFVLAQESENENLTSLIQEIELDENIQPADLGVEEPNILPDSPFYFLKNWARNIQSFFTFNSLDKARLKEKIANEKLIELKRLIEQNKNRETIENALRNYQNEIGEMERVTERIRERAEENAEVGEFLDKFIQQQTLHQGLLQKLEEQVPAEVLEKIKEAREEHLERFSEVMNRLEENKEKIQERLEKNLEEIKVRRLEKIQEQIKEQAQEREQEKVCAQVITPARNATTGECKNFPTPCDVPAGWGKVNACPTTTNMLQKEILSPLEKLIQPFKALRLNKEAGK